MKVALLSEGCYPFVTGGVSTWCDQLIRGLPEHDFDVVAVTATFGDEARLELPENVRSLRSVPLWSWVPAARPLAGGQRKKFLAALEPMLTSLVDPAADQAGFDDSLRALFEYGQKHDLSSALRGAEAAELLSRVWMTSRNRRLSVYDTLAALELLEHTMRPISEEPVRADLCHAVSNGLPSLLALTAKWKYGTPFLMSEHGVYLRERYLAFRSLHCPWPVKSIVLAFFRRLTKTAYAQADLIAPVNIFNQRWEVSHGADPDLIVTAFNGVDADRYPIAGPEPVDPTVVWVGRVDPLKDLETLVASFAIVRRSVPAAKLRLFGPTPIGNEAYAAKIHDSVAHYGLQDVITFEGPVSPVSKAYAAGHLVVLSSISEGLPYTVIEAMMSGRTTVSTDAGGVREVVGDAGILVPARDPKALAEGMVSVLEDADLRERLAVAGRARAMSYFRIEQMLGTFRDTYLVLAGDFADPTVAGTGADATDGSDAFPDAVPA